MDFSILTTECVVRMAQALLISRVSLMVGRLAGRLVISGGRITTGTTPEWGKRLHEGGYERST